MGAAPAGRMRRQQRRRIQMTDHDTGPAASPDAAGSSFHSARRPKLERDLFIGNQWRPSSTGQTLSLVNPATEQPFGRPAAASAEDVDAAVRAARAAFDTGPWPRLSLQERAAALLRFADALEADSEPLAELVVMETGLLWKEGIGGTRSMTTMLRYYADLAGQVQLVERRHGLTGVTASIEKVPLGVVGQIVPWNGPMSMTATNLPAALLAGCTIVLKPSELTPLSTGYLADAALAAGLPPGVLNVIPGSPAASEALVRHPGVNKIAFTGSTATGRKIAAAAAPTLKHVQLELGGKAAALVLDDAPLQHLIETMMPAMLFNNGQMCIQPARLVIPEHRKNEIVGAFADAFAKVVVGPPDAPGTELGPLVSRQQYNHAMDLLRSAAQDGGRFVTGGGRPPGLDTGFYVAPTIITDVSPRSRVGQEEIFAPVMVVFTYTSEEEALQIVNDTEYGLNDAVYSADAERALRLARRMESGTISINNGLYADPAMPFAGVKQSGYGQELGPEGLDAYFETQVIYLDGGEFRGLRPLKPTTAVQTSVQH
jgi:aldehyde dehydrogenase (NAD+)